MFYVLWWFNAVFYNLGCFFYVWCVFLTASLTLCDVYLLIFVELLCGVKATFTNVYFVFCITSNMNIKSSFWTKKLFRLHISVYQQQRMCLTFCLRVRVHHSSLEDDVQRCQSLSIVESLICVPLSPNHSSSIILRWTRNNKHNP